MEIKKMVIDEHEIEFVNQSLNTRNGFKHMSTCFIDGVEIGTYTAHYLNRTWEAYQFQTSMCGLINVRIESRTEYLESNFKEEHGYKNMTPKRRESFNAIVEADEYIILYKKIKEKLNGKW
jgi:hypothetical protein